jgi:hypothetical protein
VSNFILELVPLAEACWLLSGSQIKYQPVSFSVIFILKTTNDFGANPRATGICNVRVLLCQRKYFPEW